MLEDRLKKVSDWAELLLNRVPEDFQNEIVIFGSAAIVLNECLIDDEPKDMDLFITSRLFEHLVGRGFEKFQKGDIYGIAIQHGVVEAFDDFNGFSFEQVRANSHVFHFSRDVRFADLSDIKEWKTLRDLPKDIEHLRQIKAWENSQA